MLPLAVIWLELKVHQQTLNPACCAVGAYFTLEDDEDNMQKRLVHNRNTRSAAASAAASVAASIATGSASVVC